MIYKHIIWDFDGTIFDTYPAISLAFQKVLEEIGVSEPYERIMALMKISINHCIKHYKTLYNLDDELLGRYRTVRKELEEETAKPFDGAGELCAAIHACGGKNYIYTHRGASTDFFLRKFNLSQYFVELVTSDNNFPSKPSPQAIIYILGKHEILKGDAIMIGDREIDILSARNAGIRSCYFSEHGEKCISADYNTDSFASIYNVLGMTAPVEV